MKDHWTTLTSLVFYLTLWLFTFSSVKSCWYFLVHWRQLRYCGVLVVTHVIHSISDFTEILTEPGTWKNMWRAGEKLLLTSWTDLKNKYLCWLATRAQLQKYLWLMSLSQYFNFCSLFWWDLLIVSMNYFIIFKTILFLVSCCCSKSQLCT